MCGKQMNSMLNPPNTKKMVFVMNYEWLIETKVGLTSEQATRIMKKFTGKVNIRNVVQIAKEKQAELTFVQENAGSEEDQ
jgi:ribosomal protein L11